MGCCISNITELGLSFQVFLYKMIPTNEQYVFKIIEVVKSTFDKEIGVSLFQSLSEDSNEHFQNLIQTKSILTKSMYYLYSSRVRALKNYKHLQAFRPCDFPQLSKIVIIDISEALKVDISKKIIQKLTKKFIDFKDKVISAVDLKSEMEKAKNPNITNDYLNLETSNNEDTKDDPDEESVIKDDELIIELPLTKQDFSQVKGLLFQVNTSVSSTKKASKNSPSNPTPISIQLNNNNGNDNNDNDNDNNIQVEDINSNNEGEYEGNNKLKQLTKIQKIIITRSKLTTLDQFKRLLKLLTQYKSLRKFGFFNNFISNEFEGWEYLGELFSDNSSIRWIDLHSATLFDYQIGEITRGLQLKRIRYLDLSENFLSSDGMKVLSKWLSSNYTIQKLNLSRNAVCQFRPEGVRLITEALLNHPNIKSLDFSHMDLTQCGSHLNKFLVSNKKIEELNLRNLKLNYKDFKDICEALVNSFSLKKLDLGMNDMGGDKSLKEIANVILNNKVLEKLNLDQMNLNMDNYNLIFDAIEKNNTITHYSLSFNPVLKPKMVLNFFLKKECITKLDYVPWNLDNDKDKGKCFTLEEKKLIEKFSSSRPKVKLRTQLFAN